MASKKEYWYKENENDKIWWLEQPNIIGQKAFSFDKKKIYYMFRDYPYKLTPEEKAIFDRENSGWKNFFKSRNAEYEAMQKKKSKK